MSCNWLLVGETHFCKNSTRDQYCASHAFKIRKGVIIPQPCKGCGQGTKSSVRLCVPCGQDKQVSVDKRALCKENQIKQREKFIQEVSEGAVTKVIVDDSIPSVSSQRESDASTNCSNIINEQGSNSLDVCLEKTIRSCDPLAVKMGTPTFSLLYEKLCDAVILADRATQEAIFCYCQFGKAFIQRRGEIASEKQVDPESNTVSRILNIEVKTQLPADNIPFDYSIHMETQLCEPNSQSDKKNSDLSHITSSDASTESQIPNESALKKFDTK
ncbi:5452_t:CDS:2, partial [Funneliformis geosporum]